MSDIESILRECENRALTESASDDELALCRSPVQHNLFFRERLNNKRKEKDILEYVLYMIRLPSQEPRAYFGNELLDWDVTFPGTAYFVRLRAEHSLSDWARVLDDSYIRNYQDCASLCNDYMEKISYAKTIDLSSDDEIRTMIAALQNEQFQMRDIVSRGMVSEPKGGANRTLLRSVELEKLLFAILEGRP